MPQAERLRKQISERRKQVEQFTRRLNEIADKLFAGFSK